MKVRIVLIKKIKAIEIPKKIHHYQLIEKRIYYCLNLKEANC